MKPAPPSPRRTPAKRAALAAALCLLAAGTGGCQLIGFFAVGMKEARDARPRKIEAQYKGLEGKSFAVVVAADRLVQAEHPGVVEELTARITERLETGSGASGRIPADKLLAHLYSNPRWVAMPRGELAKDFGVDRLIMVELLEFRLNEPGNQYLWEGVAAATVGVIEADAPLPDEYTFERPIRVTYPDKQGFGQTDMSAEAVASVLMKRFVDRASWLFYAHDETGNMKY